MLSNVKVMGWRANGDGIHGLSPSKFLPLDCMGVVRIARSLTDHGVFGGSALVAHTCIPVFGHWVVEDCFLRTQDDSCYLSSSGPTNTCPTVYRGMTTWNDANGAAFMLIGYNGRLETSDVIYQRASWEWWNGGRVLTNRQQGTVFNVTVADLVVSDPFPSMNAIDLDMRPGSSSGSNHPGEARLHAPLHVTSRRFCSS